MQFMFLLYRDEAKEFTPAEGAEVISQQWAMLDETARLGILRGASPLQRSPASVSLRAQGGTVVSVDGPFTETKEALGGFYILECANWEEARMWGSRLASIGCSVGVEIRPLADIPARIGGEGALAAAAPHA